MYFSMFIFVHNVQVIAKPGTIKDTDAMRKVWRDIALENIRKLRAEKAAKNKYKINYVY